MRLLLVDADAGFAAGMAADLGRLGHDVTTVGDGRAALAALGAAAFDGVLLDWALPELDGIATLVRLREEGMRLPVVMLTARGRTLDMVEGLDRGADDYVVKPGSAEELAARLRAIRRRGHAPAAGVDTLAVGDIVISPSTFRAWRGGRPLEVAGLEFGLLLELARNANAVMTRAALLERVWKTSAEPATNVVDAYIYRLRTRLTAHGGDDPIRTMRGVGYMLAA